MEHRRAGGLGRRRVVVLAGREHRRAGGLGRRRVVVLAGREHRWAGTLRRPAVVDGAGQVADRAGVGISRCRDAAVGGGGLIMAPHHFLRQVGSFLRHGAVWMQEERRVGRAAGGIGGGVGDLRWRKDLHHQQHF
jgi:hypothetical protein